MALTIWSVEMDPNAPDDALVGPVVLTDAIVHILPKTRKIRRDHAAAAPPEIRRVRSANRRLKVTRDLGRKR